MFARYKNPLTRLFHKYCSTDTGRGGSRVHASSLKVMMSTDFLRMAKDLALVDARLSHRDVTTIFCNVQNEPSIANTTDMEVRRAGS